jgi:Tfp pilus assembly protein PilX
MKPGEAGTRKERGVALVIVMFALVITTIIGLSIAFTAGLEVRSSRNELLANQAFYAAEAGLQDALNVIRGQRCPISASSCDPALASNQVSFGVVAALATSNAAGDTATVPRLSRWLSYSATDDSGVVTLDAANGLYYKVQVNTLAGSADLELVSTGYAPLGAKRTVRLRVVKGASLIPPLPAVITLLGANPSGTTGNSNAHTTSGADNAVANGQTPSRDPSISQEKPIIGTVGATNVATLRDSSNFGGDKPDTFITTFPNPVMDISTTNTGGIPFNNDPAQARAFVAKMSSLAQTVLSSGASLPSGALGTYASPTIVVANGDLSIGPLSGAGILVVTGTLTLHGNFSYDGLIFVLGAGRVVRDGGGHGVVNGGFVLASYGSASTTMDGAPDFHTNGGGNSDVRYNSASIQNALNRLPITAKSFTTDATWH